MQEIKSIVARIITHKQQEEEEGEGELANSNYERAIISQIIFIKCPIKTSLGVLGKKWNVSIGFWNLLQVLHPGPFQCV
jgi:DNA-binding HxlR family transcriptional regulator